MVTSLSLPGEERLDNGKSLQIVILSQLIFLRLIFRWTDFVGRCDSIECFAKMLMREYFKISECTWPAMSVGKSLGFLWVREHFQTPAYFSFNALNMPCLRGTGWGYYLSLFYFCKSIVPEHLVADQVANKYHKPMLLLYAWYACRWTRMVSLGWKKKADFSLTQNYFLPNKRT